MVDEQSPCLLHQCARSRSPNAAAHLLCFFSQLRDRPIEPSQTSAWLSLARVGQTADTLRLVCARGDSVQDVAAETAAGQRQSTANSAHSAALQSVLRVRWTTATSAHTQTSSRPVVHRTCPLSAHLSVCPAAISHKYETAVHRSMSSALPLSQLRPPPPIHALIPRRSRCRDSRAVTGVAPTAPNGHRQTADAPTEPSTDPPPTVVRWLQWERTAHFPKARRDVERAFSLAKSPRRYPPVFHLRQCPRRRHGAAQQHIAQRQRRVGGRWMGHSRQPRGYCWC